jgi:Domain of unknown function (DUF5659)
MSPSAMGPMADYITSDLQLGAYLKHRGYELLRIEGEPGRRVFVFRGVPSEAIAAYYAGTDLVAPVPLFQAYRQLKRQLFQ